MNVNNHTYNNLYKSKLLKIVTFQHILIVISFLCLTSIYLFGTYALFNADSAYLLSIISLVLITIFRGKISEKPYWYLRPKVNQSLYANLLNIFNLVFAALCITLIYINLQGGNIEFGNLGSIIFILGLPISYYIWLTFTRNDEKGKIEIVQIQVLKDYKNVEVYFLIIFIAIFGLAYDFIPQSITFLFFLPIVLLSIVSLLNFIVNKSINKNIVKYLTYANNLSQTKDKTVEEKLFTTYEKKPYLLQGVLDEGFLELELKQQKYILSVLRRISAIDLIDALENVKINIEIHNPIHKVFTHTLEYLQKIDKEVQEINNPFEFIEQSNELIVIKGLIRKQISKSDKNLIIKLLKDNRITVKKPACIIAGYQNDINVISILIDHLENPDLSLWAQLALENIGGKTIKYLEIEYSKRKENLLFVEACFSLLCKINSEQGNQLLFRALNESDSNIRKIAAKKIILYKIKVAEENRNNFSKIYDELIITLLGNSYLTKQIELKNESFQTLKYAFNNENKESLYLLINIVKLYYNPLAVEEIFKNYQKDEAYLHSESNLLIDLIFNDNISVRNKLKTLFSPNERLLLESLQEEFPSVNLRPSYTSEEDLIWGILNKEHDQINSWTRTCALNILQYTYKEDIPLELASEFLNKNKLLNETAAINIYRNLPEFYTIFLSRLSENDATQIDYLIRSNLDIGNPKQINHDNLLLSDKINFLISIPYLNYLSITEILNFHLYFKPKVLRAGEHQISLRNEFNLGFWIIESGSASFSKNGIDFYKYNKRDIIKISDHDSESENAFFILEEDVRFLLVDEVILLNIIVNYDSIMQQYIDVLPDEKIVQNIKKLNKEAA